METVFQKIELRKTGIDLITRISETRNIPEERVREMMMHMCWTPQQFSELTGKTVNTINNLANQGKQVDNKRVKALNLCYSFPTRDRMGPKFIVRDELSEGILEKSLEKSGE